MLIGRGHFRENRRWIALILLLSAAAIGWYCYVGFGAHRWPGGSSLPGLVFGTVGGAVILFEFLLWPRKKVRSWRIGRAQTWMRAHIWLGLLTFPLIVLHTGFHMGGQLSTLLLILYLGVMASGVIGLIIQQRLPALMLERVPAETIYSQINRVANCFYQEAENLVLAICGPTEEDVSEEENVAEAPVGTLPFITIGAVRDLGRVRGKVTQTTVVTQKVEDSQPLREVFAMKVGPYLLEGSNSNSTLRDPRRAASVFIDLKSRLPAAAHEAVDSLERWCDQRRQLDAQSRLHFWLHSWLWLHLPMSIALVLLMFVHVFVALKYW